MKIIIRDDKIEKEIRLCYHSMATDMGITGTVRITGTVL